MSIWRISGMVSVFAALWVLLWGSVTFANVLGGLLVGAAVVLFAREQQLGRGDPDEMLRFRPLALFKFGAYFVYKLVEANLQLAWEIITPRDNIRTGLIAVPLRTESETAMLVVANVITLTPGTVTLDAIGTPPTLYVHVLHLHDLERVRADLLRIEELSVEAFGSRAARRQLAERRAA